jgi:hypothetical protein
MFSVKNVLIFFLALIPVLTSLTIAFKLRKEATKVKVKSKTLPQRRNKK